VLNCDREPVVGRKAHSGTECSSLRLNPSFADTAAGSVWALPDADLYQNTVALPPRDEHRYVESQF
jgi:hypothetical protein